LNATREYVPATEKKIRGVFRELDAIEGFSGQLNGYTNLHGAFRDAFEMTTRNRVNGGVAYDLTHMAKGCDTILLLSDGTPTYDDFWKVASGEKTQTFDVESQQVTGERRSWVEVGPFDELTYLLADVERWNLLRGCSIHVVGLGESDPWLLEQVARIGNGQVLQIGKD